MKTKHEISKPIVYVDMDGVQAALHPYVAKACGLSHYKQLTQKQWDIYLESVDAYELFRDLELYDTAHELLELVHEFVGEYHILSSPLYCDKPNSIRGKEEWIDSKLRLKPKTVTFEHDKYLYAVQPNGTPNILIDDFQVNIDKWTAAGGIAIHYHAEEHEVAYVRSTLEGLGLNSLVISEI